MKIILDKVGKRYNQEWIFRNLSVEFSSNMPCAVLGPNGSGKSTFLQLIAGNITPSEGDITYFKNNVSVENENIFNHLSIVAPYLDLPEEFTLFELICFHSGFKRFIAGLSANDILNCSGLKKYNTRQLRYYSSGMKQRAKLALALLSDSDILLLDEPASNLDKEGIAWFRELMAGYSKNRIVLVCSNQYAAEYDFCKIELQINEYR